jgi:hypothetical protein
MLIKLINIKYLLNFLNKNILIQENINQKHNEKNTTHFNCAYSVLS